MISVVLISVRKNFKGKVLEENILEILPQDPQAMITDLGQLIGRALAADSGFSEFCKKYRELEGKCLLEWDSCEYNMKTCCVFCNYAMECDGVCERIHKE